MTRSQAFGLFLLLALWLFIWDFTFYFVPYNFFQVYVAVFPYLNITLYLALGGYVLAGIFGVLFLSKRLKVVRA